MINIHISFLKTWRFFPMEQKLFDIIPLFENRHFYTMTVEEFRRYEQAGNLMPPLFFFPLSNYKLCFVYSSYIEVNGKVYDCTSGYVIESRFPVFAHLMPKRKERQIFNPYTFISE